ncbi:hypothetical protein GCM10020331_097800 [Ectobacillus funiculus]
MPQTKIYYPLQSFTDIDAYDTLIDKLKTTVAVTKRLVLILNRMGLAFFYKISITFRSGI